MVTPQLGIPDSGQIHVEKNVPIPLEVNIPQIWLRMPWYLPSGHGNLRALLPACCRRLPEAKVRCNRRSFNIKMSKLCLKMVD